MHRPTWVGWWVCISGSRGTMWPWAERWFSEGRFASWARLVDLGDH